MNNYRLIADKTEIYHRNKTFEYEECVKKINLLEKSLKQSIEKSE